MWALASPAVEAQQAQALAPQELAQCAQMIQTLGVESARLNQRAAAFDRRRAALGAQPLGSGDGGDTQAWARNNSLAAAFNRDMEQFRLAVVQINEVKQTYERQCAGRPYRQSDLEKLPAAAQAAMHGGLAGVRVPFIQ